MSAQESERKNTPPVPQTIMTGRLPCPIRTFCNPLPIPDYPLGGAARSVLSGSPAKDIPLWLLDHAEQFRELADPSALWFDGKWHLFPSCEMAWVSEDNGGSWQHHPLNIRDIGYAPTIVRHRGRFLLLASGSGLYASEDPLGPYEPLGEIRIPSETEAPSNADPMLFSDDDDRLYLYWGCTKNRGIWAAELDTENPTEMISSPQEVIPCDPVRFPWEAGGEWNQDPSHCWIEGSWMLKVKATYYLTYSAAGTENRTYAMGCYTSRSPLGPFTPQKRNPFLRTIHGLVTGTAHGCVVPGPEGLWVFYTIRAGAVHAFERRIGMDRAIIDTQGELCVAGNATSLPQWLPGFAPADRSDTGWVPLNHGMQTIGSSAALHRPGRLAVDNDLRTWWQPAEEETTPVLTSRLPASSTVRAVRIVWRDVGLDTQRGILPGPFRYRIELETDKAHWLTILDRTENDEDLLVDYRECAPGTGSRVRLVITGWPKGLTPGVADFSVFGEPVFPASETPAEAASL